MYIGLAIIACSLVYILIITYSYFSKQRVESTETKIYGYMIFLSIISLFFEFLSIILVSNYHILNLVSELVNKGFLISILIWSSLFTHYIYSVSFLENAKKTEIQQKKYQKLVKPFVYLIVILVILIIVFPLEFYSSGEVVYSYGLAIDLLNLTIICMVIAWLIFSLMNYKSLKIKKYLPVFVFIICIIITLIVRNINPELLLINGTISLVTVMMYHTIENPDLKLIHQLNDAKDAAEKANNAKTDFLSNMSHEIRTPLNAIVGFSNGLLEENLSNQATEDVKNIVSASDSLLELVNGILDISKIEANKLEIINMEYSFKKLFDELVVLIKARMADKAIDFRYFYDESIPEYLYGDASRIKQIMINLLTNSVKYTKEGYIDFKINSVVNNDMIRLIMSVEDSGIGIKKENIDKLFTKFERLGVEKETTAEGTGLGLAITKRLVELMNGKIIVQSIIGKGSKFTVSIDQKIVCDDKINKIKNSIETVSKSKTDFSDKKIFIVDDNALNIKVAERLLKIYNVNIESAMSGQECIDKITSGSKYDLILLDDMMPKMTGVETLKKLELIEGFNMPVVVLTANAITGMREKYINDGFDDYLSKPIEKPELDRVIKIYLNK
ncbi:MAG: response regulator [Tenericutes bacterium]|nr:response regulator [Mycoplasmatota bacterium]